MKKAILTSLFVLSVSSVSLAAPITDYSTEKLGVDISSQPNLHFGCNADIDGKTNNLDFGITAALNNKWGIQYVYNNFKSNTVNSKNDYVSYNAHTNLKVNQFNLTYNSSKNKVLFLGVTKHQLDLSANALFNNKYNIESSDSSNNITGIQFGMIEVVPINDNLSSYGIMSIGTKLFNVEMGLSQQISKNIDFNIFYKYMKCTDIGDTNLDISTTGLGFGVSCKF